MSEDIRKRSRGREFDELSRRIIGCAIEVHRSLGPGFEERFYQRALAMELQAARIEFCREEPVDILYKGEKLGSKRMDFLVEGIIVEMKAKAALEPVDHVQTLSYLKASGMQLGLLINFGGSKVEVERLVNHWQGG